jgi:hypothetical protein
MAFILFGTNLTAVPERASVALLGMGIAALAAWRRFLAG